MNDKGIVSDGKYATGTYPTQVLIYSENALGLIYSGSQWIPVVGYENNPVINVTWYGASEFASYANGTLPTEAQWEYACRGSSTTPFNTGSCLTNLQANYDWAYPQTGCTNTSANSVYKTQAVGSYPPNAYGLHDMHGNVSEWCSDWYDAYPTDTQSNPTGAASGILRVERGGCWPTDARGCRSAYRSYAIPSEKYSIIGFRVVLLP